MQEAHGIIHIWIFPQCIIFYDDDAGTGDDDPPEYHESWGFYFLIELDVYIQIRCPLPPTFGADFPNIL